MSDLALLKQDLLDLLLNGPSSFAAVFGALRRHHRVSNVDWPIAQILSVLIDLEKAGHVKVSLMTESGPLVPTPAALARTLAAYESWLPTACPADLAVDEIGLWFELTPAGRVTWDRDATEDAGQWSLDEDAEQGTLCIHAQTEHLARERLEWWLAQNPRTNVRDLRVERVAAFILRTGVEVIDGVRLTCRYQRLAT